MCVSSSVWNIGSVLINADIHLLFFFNGRPYDQKDGIAIALPMALVVANCYMENFE
jgi:hypothetical protein